MIKKRKRDKSKYRLFKSGPRTLFLTDEKRVFMLAALQVRESTFNLVIAECAPRLVDSNMVSYAEELFNAVVYDTSESGIDEVLSFMAQELCKGEVDIENPVDFAMSMGGTIKGRPLISTTPVPKSKLN